MKHIAGAALAAVTVLAVSSVASSSPSRRHRGTRQPWPRPAAAPSRGIEAKVNALLAKMTTTEKLQQVQLLSDSQVTEADAQAGVGGVFSLVDPAKINHLQHIAVEQSRLHIPILFAYDTIHGYRTIFPVPLATASSFDPSVAQADATIGARESATVGLKQIYSPMVDVSHEPRWGRIVEGNGEDPYVGSVMAAARVKGAQGSDYSKQDKVVTSVKHFVGYGQPEGGRDYNTTDMSESTLRNIYLPPFKAAIDAGADTVMCSFNAINGVPGCANPYTETDILKNEWGFDGFIESDYTAVAETRACPPVKPDEGPCGHGTAADGPEAGANALMAGTDSEMVSTNIRDYGVQLLSQHRITMSRLDDAVRRILRVKFRAGLFDHPYVDQAKATDPASFLTPADRAAARTRGRQVDGAAEERRRHPALRPEQEDRRHRPARRRPARHARPVVGTGQGRGRGERARRHLGPVAGSDVRPGLHPEQRRATGLRPRQRLRVRRRLRRCGRGGQRGGPGRAGPGGDQGDERRGDQPVHARPARSAAGAHRRDQGHREAVRGRAVQRPTADARRRGRELAGDPRVLVPGCRGRQRGRRRRLREDRPGRQAAGLVPAAARPGADLLQPRADRTALRRDPEVRLALPRPPLVRPAVRLRLRAQLHDVLGHGAQARPDDRVGVRTRAREHDGDQHR